MWASVVKKWSFGYVLQVFPAHQSSNFNSCRWRSNMQRTAVLRKQYCAHLINNGTCHINLSIFNQVWHEGMILPGYSREKILKCLLNPTNREGWHKTRTTDRFIFWLSKSVVTKQEVWNKTLNACLYIRYVYKALEDVPALRVTFVSTYM